MTRKVAPTGASVLPFITLFVLPAVALDVNVKSVASITNTSSQILEGLMKTYANTSASTGGFVQVQPWYWWLSGTGWNAVLDYTVYTNDTAYKADLLTALNNNVGANYDFAPAEQSGWEANDDQAYWLYNALTALEYDFDEIQPCVGEGLGVNGTCQNSWLSIATNTFNDYVSRWFHDNATCGGGLKWQYNQAANPNGYFYKNSVTNGGFFQTAARLARYTGNSTYAHWAGTIWDWSAAVGLITSGARTNVVDGASDSGTDNCTAVNDDKWSYNIGTYLMGAANMYAYTGDQALSNQQATWQERVSGLLAGANHTFFSPPTGNATGVMYEQNCELTAECNTDQTSFKSSLARWMAKTAVLVPSFRDDIVAMLATTAQRAAASCVDASGSLVCGQRWWIADGYDGLTEFGSMLSSLDAVQSLLVERAPQLAKLGN